MKEKQKLYHVASVMVWVCCVLVFYVLGGGTQAGVVEATESAHAGINLTIPQAHTQDLSDTRLQAVMRQNVAQSRDENTLQKQNASAFQWHVEEQPEAHRQAAVVDVPLPVTPPAVSQALPPRPKRKVGTARRRFERERQEAFLAKQEQIKQLMQLYMPQVQPQQTTQPVAAAPDTLPKAYVVQAGTSQAGFYGLATPTEPITHIRAVVHGEHKNLQRGAVVKLRLLDAIRIEDTLIPANTFLYGKLSFASFRAMITIQNIQYQQQVFPFRGTIYDNDGFEGLYVPNNRVEEAGRKAGAQALGSANIRVPGASYIGSMVNSALGAVQSVAQQTVSEQKITISSNYLVTIKQ